MSGHREERFHQSQPHRGKYEPGLASTEPAKDETGIADLDFVLPCRIVQAQKTIRNSMVLRYFGKHSCGVPPRDLNTAGSEKLGEKSSDHPAAFSF
jgi:hypothetical protein